MADAVTIADKVTTQMTLNTIMHDDINRDKPISMKEWALIASEHMGHLNGAVLRGEISNIEKELLHTMAPLFELYRVVLGYQRGRVNET